MANLFAMHRVVSRFFGKVNFVVGFASGETQIPRLAV